MKRKVVMAMVMMTVCATLGACGTTAQTVEPVDSSVAVEEEVSDAVSSDVDTETEVKEVTEVEVEPTEEAEPTDKTEDDSSVEASDRATSSNVTVEDTDEAKPTEKVAPTEEVKPTEDVKPTEEAKPTEVAPASNESTGVDIASQLASSGLPYVAGHEAEIISAIEDYSGSKVTSFNVTVAGTNAKFTCANGMSFDYYYSTAGAFATIGETGSEEGIVWAW